MKDKKSENSRIKVKYDDIAVAIKHVFAKKGEVPKVVASGRGYIAAQILELAKEHEIPQKTDEKLAQSLIKVPAGTQIPEELWEAMAEILAQIYHLDEKMRQKSE